MYIFNYKFRLYSAISIRIKFLKINIHKSFTLLCHEHNEKNVFLIKVEIFTSQ